VLCATIALCYRYENVRLVGLRLGGCLIDLTMRVSQSSSLLTELKLTLLFLLDDESQSSSSLLIELLLFLIQDGRNYFHHDTST
jgi:hypothetical protein